LVGGAQAIAALAFGTESVERADVIVGPGNIYVALAKREVSGFVQIDSVAGPSEIAIVTDGGADPLVLAADLIAQAEHGPHGSFLLVTWEPELVPAVETGLASALAELAAPEGLRASLEEGAAAVLVSDLDQALEAVNRFAPEHVELIFQGAESAVERVRGAGAIFVGPWSPVSLGDYLAGTSHVLPTGGAAAWSSPLRTSHFQKTSTFAIFDRSSLEVALPPVRALARAEGLPNHARALEARLLNDEAKGTPR
ncbi:MAG: histidinol dehydrogenase, partial [Candidatus Methylomirabilales bacterium]